MVEVIPAILTENARLAEELIARCDGIVRRVQLDIIDGVFANNTTIKPQDLKKINVSLGYDFHLMVKDPIFWVEACRKAAGDRIIAQIEMMESQEAFVKEVQSKDLRVGLALDLDTPVSELQLDVLRNVDVVLVMSVKAGFGGQKFDPIALGKISELNEIRLTERIPFRICVDGGETEEVADDSFWTGADEIVVGQRLFKGDLAANIKRFESASVK